MTSSKIKRKDKRKIPVTSSVIELLPWKVKSLSIITFEMINKAG
jgi:hypothetical protein